MRPHIIAIIALLVWLLAVWPALSQSAEIIVEAGGSTPILESFESGHVPEATLRMATFRSGHAQIYIGEVERDIQGELTIKDASGVQVGSAEFSIPLRFGFVGIDAVAETDGWARIGASGGLALFDKLDETTDGTLWRFHFGTWISLGREIIVRLAGHHFSNGEDTPLKSPGPNFPLEFITLGVGIRF